MKPLTIDELKLIEPFDYIYVVDKTEDFSAYAHKDDLLPCFGSNIRFVAFEHNYYLNDYGKTWVAYKNKEQAEAKGEIVELPCLRDTGSVGAHWQLVYLNKYNQAVTICYDDDELDIAKAKLAELEEGNRE